MIVLYIRRVFHISLESSKKKTAGKKPKSRSHWDKIWIKYSNINPVNVSISSKNKRKYLEHQSKFRWGVFKTLSSYFTGPPFENPKSSSTSHQLEAAVLAPFCSGALQVALFWGPHWTIGASRGEVNTSEISRNILWIWAIKYTWIPNPPKMNLELLGNL